MNNTHGSMPRADEEVPTASPVAEMGSDSDGERKISTDSSGPLSPQTTSPNNPHVYDLPPALIEKGWRKWWSQRLNRHYYYNKFSNESVWDEPSIEVS